MIPKNPAHRPTKKLSSKNYIEAKFGATIDTMNSNLSTNEQTFTSPEILDALLRSSNPISETALD